MASTAAVRHYWDTHLHDVEITTSPSGTRAFFDQLEAYRFEKLDYLPHCVDFNAYSGKRLLEIGCGVGLDLARFATGGARVTGVELSNEVIKLAKQHLEQQAVQGTLGLMDGEQLAFADESFDVVYAHGVLQYTPNTQRMIHEIARVLRPGGEAILMAYNRYSWLYGLSKLCRTKLEHEDAPTFQTFSQRQLRRLLNGFSRVDITPERFPMKTRLHHGLKAHLYNTFFVGAFNAIPRPLVRSLGWHLMVKALK